VKKVTGRRIQGERSEDEEEDEKQELTHGLGK
jgi:hypothetical protein